MHTLPIDAGLRAYSACCGKTICGGCGLQHQLRSRELGETCAFCRTALPDSDEEILAQLRKRVERKDPTALYNLALKYGRGRFGLPVDQAKCINLLRQSADLGNPDAHYSLGCSYYEGELGLERNKEEGTKYLEKAAEGGNIIARCSLGITEGRNGNDVAAMRHVRLSASGGHKKSMEALIECFENGCLHHGDLAGTLAKFYRAKAEMTSADRDLFIASNGEDEAAYD